MSESKNPGLKSAYELALERMLQDGIEPPREDSMDQEARDAVGEIRRRAEAKLAELEILHKDRLARAMSPADQEKERSEFALDRSRIEEDRDRRIERLRQGK